MYWMRDFKSLIVVDSKKVSSENVSSSCMGKASEGKVNSVLSKKATTELEVLSRQKNISISSNAQKKVMILMHL